MNTVQERKQARTPPHIPTHQGRCRSPAPCLSNSAMSQARTRNDQHLDTKPSAGPRSQHSPIQVDSIGDPLTPHHQHHMPSHQLCPFSCNRMTAQSNQCHVYEHQDETHPRMVPELNQYGHVEALHQAYIHKTAKACTKAAIIHKTCHDESRHPFTHKTCPVSGHPFIHKTATRWPIYT